MNGQRGVTREWVTAGRTAWKQSFPFSNTLAETRTWKIEKGGGGGRTLPTAEWV